MAIRTSIRGAARDPAQIGLIRRAIGRMKTVGDERGFYWFASVHGLALPFWCEHGTPLFLPWHRAYLYYFELAMQTRLGPRFTPIEPQDPALAEVGLPWWDWTSGVAADLSVRASGQPLRAVTKYAGIENATSPLGVQ